MTGFTKILLAGTVLAASVAAAQAGGFSRGNADTDILYEPGEFTMRSGLTVVSPRRSFTRHYDPGLVGREYTKSYVVPSFAMKFQPFEAFGCAGTFVQAYGGEVDYTGRTTPGKVVEDYSVNEFGLTCAVNFEVGPGNLYFLGGLFHEKFEYERTQRTDISDLANLPPLSLPLIDGALALTGTDTGYRIGVGYDIPEIAVRGQLLYRSGTSYGADGTLLLDLPLALGGPTTIPALGLGELPQSVELKLQSGIAPGWLAFATIKWTDWSVLDTLDVVNAINGAELSQDEYFWRDGWTVTGGVGHAFNEQVSGLASLTWDRGVGTGYDLQSDTWTLALGASVRDNWGGELRGGIGVSYLTSAASPLDPNIPAGSVAPAVGGDWSTAVSVGYKINW